MFDKRMNKESYLRIINQFIVELQSMHTFPAENILLLLAYSFTEDLSTGSDSYITNCGKDEYCLTDMEVDWLPIGEQITTIRRKCSKESFPSRLD